MSERIRKVNKLIKEEIARLISVEVDFPGGVLVTVMRVETSLDLRYADVAVSVIPHSDADAALALLCDEIYGLQQQLNRRLHMKPVPKIRFVEDLSGEKVDRVNELLARS